MLRYKFAFVFWVVLTSVAHASVPRKIVAFPEGERLVYTKLIEAYHRNQMDQVVHNRQVLERNYPLSVHLDNAYYLQGTMQFSNNQLGEALRTFAVVRDRFVKSNKRPAALFAMASTYQRLNLEIQSRRVLQRIMQEYPGSSEAQRAWLQLRAVNEKPKAAALKR